MIPKDMTYLSLPFTLNRFSILQAKAELPPYSHLPLQPQNQTSHSAPLQVSRTFLQNYIPVSAINPKTNRKCTFSISPIPLYLCSPKLQTEHYSLMMFLTRLIALQHLLTLVKTNQRDLESSTSTLRLTNTRSSYYQAMVFDIWKAFELLDFWY